MSNAPHPADMLRATVTECPNGCPGEMLASEHADGLHLTCSECGFVATEEWARRLMEKLG
jgi:ribosomal protein S27AE